MVDEVSRDITTGFKTVLAERMLGNISLTNNAPAVTVNLVVIRAANVKIIFPTGESFMNRTITSFPDALRAAGISAGFEWFLWHGITPIQAALRRDAGGEGRL